MTTIRDGISIGSMTLKNRLYRAPVLEGAGNKKNAAAAYAKHFVPNAEAGLGLIIQGNTIVTPEGRTSPGMSSISGREDMLKLKPMTDAVHEAGGRIVVQLGHGGVFSIEAWHREFRANRSRPPMAPSKLPLWLRMIFGKVYVPSTAEVEELVERFGIVAAWAREAGYDAVQLAGGNAKLLHQFLSPTYNRRKDKYGGDLEGRATILCEIREAIRKEAGADYPVLLKYPALERGLFGGNITLEDGVKLAQIAEQAGFDAVTPVIADVLPNTAICRGDYPVKSLQQASVRKRLLAASGGKLRMAAISAGMWLAARRYPFSPLWNRPIFKAVKAAVSIPVFAVGGIRSPEQAAEILSGGEADLIGVGRPFYAEPDLAARFLKADVPFAPMACENCNRCIIPQMLGLPGVCYNPASNQRKHETATQTPTKQTPSQQPITQHAA